MNSRSTTARVFLLALAGILCVQSAWMLVVPPFRGLDEHDHAFKAAAVARGDLSPTHEPSTQGWGQLVRVPTDLVEAARPVCEEFPYTTEDNCVGRPTTDPGVRRVASSAAPYSPLFYVLVGPTSLPFEGAGSLYALRAAAALLCAILIAISFTVLRRWSKTTWPAMALVLALTPTFTYSVSMAAPNGLELAAALAVWVALLGIARAPARRPPTRLVGLTGVAGVLVAATRGLGPLWLLLIVGTVSLLVPWHALRHILKTRGVRHAALAGTLATLFAGWWVLASESTEVSSRYHFDDSPWAALPAQWVLWFFQSIAAFPARDELAPLALYVIAFAAWGLLVFLGLRVANGREKFAMTVVVVASTAVASSIIIATYETLGAAWQGRYGYPYTLGFLLLCGFALDRSGRWPAARWPVVAAAITMWMLLLIGHLDVLADQTRTSSLAGSDAWLQPHPALVIVLDTLGCALLLRSLMPWRVISVAPDSLPEWTGSRTTVSTSSGGPAAHS